MILEPLPLAPMAKPPDKEPPAKQTGSLHVVSASGARTRFLRGMVTHDLVRRGVEFDEAYATARDVRDALMDREEVGKDELRVLIASAVAERLGPEVISELAEPDEAEPRMEVITKGQTHPFSKGLLAETIYASGVPAERAYRLAAQVESQLRKESVSSLPSTEVARRVDVLLEQHAGVKAKLRYRMIRRINRLPRPVIVYIGGASGTGKSSLALQLARLLRIYRVSSTDTIRQVMRMVFTPEILPALHHSSFELTHEANVTADHSFADNPDTLRESYQEQARRVCVGTRAVIERTIQENVSIIVEGVHLLPGIVPFADLAGEAYQVAIMLGTPDEESLRTRILTRAPAGSRRAERYLDAFDDIRAINDHLMQMAEAHDIPFLDTSRDGDPEVHAVQLVTAELERQVPALAHADWVDAHSDTATLLLIIDGVADRAVRALGGRTPLQAANTPNLDRLAREGTLGLADPVAPGVVPDTAAGTLALFGQSPRALKRGPVEALGAGLEMLPGDIALRANLSTVDDDGNVVDRRAGRIRDGAAALADALDAIRMPESVTRGVQLRVKAATEHRLAIVAHGPNLSPAITGSDPGDGAPTGSPLTVEPIDSANEAAAHTARLLSAFEAEARAVLEIHPINESRRRRGDPPANALLSRGAGRLHRLVSLEEAGIPLHVSCISGDRTVIGLARWLGAETVYEPQMTANLDTDLSAKIAAAMSALEQGDLTILHVKGADIAAHDRRPDLKVQFLERLDRELGVLLDAYADKPLRVGVASDHATLSESGQHAADPLPVLLWGAGFEADSAERFDESAAAVGALGRFPLQILLGRLFELG